MEVLKHTPTETELEERLWIEIIETIESMYAKLAATQTEMEEKNEELQRTGEMVRNIIRSMINALVVADRNGRIFLANEACARTLGYAEGSLIGKPLKSLFPEGADNPVFPGTALWETLIEVGRIRDVETKIRLADDQAIPVSLNASIIHDASGNMDGAMLVAYDLRALQKALNEARAEAEESARAYRELKALQAKLIQSEKMSSLGRMAAGVAHEINNPLGAILVYSHLLLESTPDRHPGRETLLKIIRETNRCKEIGQELLGFARTQPGKRRVHDLCDIVRATIELVCTEQLFHQLTCRFDPPRERLVIEAEKGQIQQALINLFENAAEAMNGSGAIMISAWSDREKNTANLRVLDSGPGIPAEELDRLFEPFFTTKEEG